jgi:hypothetical protein
LGDSLCTSEGTLRVGGGRYIVRVPIRGTYFCKPPGEGD